MWRAANSWIAAGEPGESVPLPGGSRPGQAKRMVSAYVLIEATPTKAMQACTQIRRIHAAKAAHLVSGPDDIVAHVEAEDPGSVERLVLSMIQEMDGVGKTIPCVVI